MDTPVPVSRRSALAAGFTDYELSGAAWRRVRRGHYVDAACVAGLTDDQRHLVAVRAVTATVSADARVSHISAAIAHELPTWAIPMARVHITRNRSSGGRMRRQLVVHTGRILPDEQIEVDGLRVTSVARTVVDLARTVPFEQAVVVGDAALRSGKTTRTELAGQLDRAIGRSGRPAARRVVDFLDGRTESVGESRSRVALRQSDLPAPELQARVIAQDQSSAARVDFLWPDLGVIGEFDGMIKYHKEMRGGRTPEQVVIEEKAREDALRALGWIVVRWTWSDLEHPEAFLTRLSTAAQIARPTPRLGKWLPAPRI